MYTSTNEKNDGLIDRKVFVLASTEDARGHKIIGSRFVECTKNEGTPNAFEKPMLVAQD